LVSFSQENNKISQDLENFSGQYAECAAYYRLVSYAMESSNELKTSETYQKLEGLAGLYSHILASEGRSDEMAFEITKSRIEMYIKNMKKEANNRNENISVLINKYNFECNNLIENPPNDIKQIFKKYKNK
jgi:hypothetical protein